jgi:hypothetical protein
LEKIRIPPEARIEVPNNILQHYEDNWKMLREFLNEEAKRLARDEGLIPDEQLLIQTELDDIRRQAKGEFIQALRIYALRKDRIYEINKELWPALRPQEENQWVSGWKNPAARAGASSADFKIYGDWHSPSDDASDGGSTTVPPERLLTDETLEGHRKVSIV